MHEIWEVKKRQYHNVLIIAGTGRKSGKTSLACMIIERFSSLNPVAVKISPHFHEPAEGLLEYYTGDKYNIYLETKRDGNKDTSRMLRSGAIEAYYIQAYDEDVRDAFIKVILAISDDTPVVCESPSLGKYIDPGILFITDSEDVILKKDISDLLPKAKRIIYSLHKNPDIDKLIFSGGNWVFG